MLNLTHYIQYLYLNKKKPASIVSDRLLPRLSILPFLLGLASPSLMFVSQSVVLKNDAYMSIRLSHEISHNWFGLVIGALDWTEEWLSEVRIFTLMRIS